MTDCCLCSRIQFAVLYNIVTVPIRIGFSQALLAGENRTLAALDFVVDILYLCDLLVKSRMGKRCCNFTAPRRH